MKELNFETPDISIIKSIKSGIKIIINNIKTISLGLAIPTLLFALIATVTICGNVGVVKIDYNHYMPYHEISEWFLAKYIIGTLVSVVLFMLWRGYTFHYLSNFDKEKKAFCVKTSRISDFFYSGLRFIQFCLLAFIVFGIIGAILAYISITVSAWLWTAFIIYAVFVSVPLYISGYEYMLNDINFRTGKYCRHHTRRDIDNPGSHIGPEPVRQRYSSGNDRSEFFTGTHLYNGIYSRFHRQCACAVYNIDKHIRINVFLGRREQIFCLSGTSPFRRQIRQGNTCINFYIHAHLILSVFFTRFSAGFSESKKYV